MQNIVEIVYILAGIILPLYYYPQIRTCLKDQTQLRAYSLRKSMNQFLLRVCGMPFLIGVLDNGYLTFVVCLDVTGRALELSAAIYSLRNQGVTWEAIRRRLRHRDIRRSIIILLADLREIGLVVANMIRGRKPEIAVRENEEQAAKASPAYRRAPQTSEWSELSDTTILPAYVLEDVEQAEDAARRAAQPPARLG